MIARSYLWVLAALLCGGCAGGGNQEVPSDWRRVLLNGCCAINVPPDMTTPMSPAGTVTDVKTLARSGLSVSFQYASITDFPAVRTGQLGWSQDQLEIDGRRADMVAYDAVEPAFSGGRSIFVRVMLPENSTFMSAPASEQGMELGVSMICRTEADCDTAMEIVNAIDFPPF